MVWSKIKEIQDIKISEILDGRSKDVLTWIHGSTHGRSAMSEDPTSLVDTKPLYLSARFQNKPGYALFQNNLYFVQFGWFKPIVTLLPIAQDDLEKIRPSFPPESSPLATFSEEELRAFHDYLDPLPTILTENFSFNTTLLSPYFKDMYEGGRPFIEFSDIGIVSSRSLATTLLPELVNNIRQKHYPYQNIDQDFHDIPFIILMNNKYYLYGNTDGATWAITELDRSILVNSQGLNFTETPTRVSFAAQYFPIYHHILEKNAHTHFSTQPQQVTQLKKLLNSAYYFKLMTQDFESMDFSFSTLFKVITHFQDYRPGAIYDKAYRALSLVTDVELNYVKAFHEEIAELKTILDRFKHYSRIDRTYIPEAEATAPFLAPGTYEPSYSFQAGNAVGFATRYIYDQNGHWDTAVLSQFSVDFPAHIDKITTWINANTANVKQYAPNINPTQLRSLQNEANKLLRTLKNTQKNAYLNSKNPFNPLRQMGQIFNYIILISQIINILTATLTQVGHLNDAYQELLRTYLMILKMAILILVKYCDRAEIEMIGAPGISRPLLRKLTDAYLFITDRIKNLADFSFRGEDLLILEDPYFAHTREANILALLQNSQIEQQKLAWTQEATTQFFSLLDSAPLTALKIQFANMAPYLEHINPELNRQVIAILNNPHGTLEHLVPNLKTARGRIVSYLTQLQATESLRQQQIQHVIAALPIYTGIQLFPYYDRIGCDITLKIVRGLPLHTLKFTHLDPVLIQHHYRGEVSYVFYGNTDGTHWGFSSPIEKQFLDVRIQRHFTKLATMMQQSDYQPNTPYVLYYHKKYESLYQQMINKKAHTRYRSQLCSLESEALSHEKPSLATMLFKPVDWVAARLTHAPAEAAVTSSTAPVDDTIVHINATTDRVRDIHLLSAAQALNLYFWYQQKMTAHQHAREYFLEFQRLINKHFKPDEIIQFDQSSTTQKLCQYYYYKIQPYCIGMVNFPLFDQRLVQALSVLAHDASDHYAISPPPKWPTITCSELNHILDRFSLFDKLEPLTTSWETRAELIRMQARIAYQTEQTAALAKQQTQIMIDPRANFLLKTTAVSTKIREFHESIGLWALSFHRKIQDELSLRFILAELSEDEFRNLKMILNMDQNIAACNYLDYRGLEFTVEDLKTIKSRLALTPEGLKLSQKFVLNPRLYREIGDLNRQLEQTPIVLLVKRFLNALYHLEHVAQNIESIPMGTVHDAKTYTINLVTTMLTDHGIPLKELIVALHKDPLLAKLGEDLYQQYTSILQQTLDLIQPHTTPPAQVLAPGEAPVASGGLWYVMNFFHMLPHHLLSLTNQSDHNLGYGIHLITDMNDSVATPQQHRLSLIQHQQHYYIYGNGTGRDWKLRRLPAEVIAPLHLDFNEPYLDYHHQYQPLYDFLAKHRFHFTKMNALQLSAMQATKHIESIIQNAAGNHYFKLFLSLPMIYRLNQDLQAQTKTFTRTAQEIVMSHLEILQTDYFSSLLVLADTKEHEWGLNHGELTEPIQAIIDELNSGLLFQLKFESFKNREDLNVSTTILFARILAEEKRLESLSIEDEEHRRHYEDLVAFTESIAQFKSRLPAGVSSWFSTAPAIPTELINRYQQAILPSLDAHRRSFIPEWFAEIPSTLSSNGLPIIKRLITKYHQSLSALFLVHNATDRALYESLQPFLARLNSPSLSADLATQYTTTILPKLIEYRHSFVPDWLKLTHPTLNSETLDTIDTQANAYCSHLKGLERQRRLKQNLSTEKLHYLWQRLGVPAEAIRAERPNFSAVEHADTHEPLPLNHANIEAFRPSLQHHRQAIARNNSTKRYQYKQKFGKHYFYTCLNRLPYKASGLKDTKIHRAFHHELRRYLVLHEAEILQNAVTHEAVDTHLDEIIQSRIATFKQQCFSRYQCLDRVQTAVNEFKTYLNQDQNIPPDLRRQKMQRLTTMEALIARRDRGDTELSTFLNEQSQLLSASIQEAENTLLAHYPQFNSLFAWLIDCLVSLFKAIGLYTPERERRYANLAAAHQPQPPLPTGWQRFMNFRPTRAPSTPPRSAQENQDPRILTPFHSLRRVD